MTDGTLQILLTGASGYVGGRLVPELVGRSHALRSLSRRPDAASPAGGEVVRGDVLTGEGLEQALDGVDCAYYLVHSMGRGSGPAAEFAERDRRGAANFARAAKAAGVGRMVYLGGLGPADGGGSEHLASRHEVAEILRREGPRLVYVRAAMILGAGSTSFTVLRSLVHRLPVMLGPRWVQTRSQPVSILDVVSTLAALADHPDPPHEVQLGGADVLSYREMLLRTADLLGRRRPPILPVPVLSPRLSSYWVSLFSPVEPGLVRPLVDGLSVETVVERPPPPGLNDHPLDFDAGVRAALVE